MMNWTKYKATLLIFTAVIAIGTSTALSRFNHRVCPQTPVRAFALKNDGPGVYQVNFLGESMRLELPVNLAYESYDHKYLKSSKEYLEGKILLMRRYGESVLDGPFLELNDLERNASKMKTFLEKWLKPAEAE